MIRSTRSNTNLSGDISDYLLEAVNKEMSTDQNDTANTSAANGTGGSGLRAGGVDDMHSLLAMMARALNTITEQHNQNQRSSKSTGVVKIDDCPLKRKESTLESWISEVLLWNESYNNSEPGINGKKYLKFIDSARKSEDCSDLKNFIQVEFAENASFDKKQDDIIVVMINKIKARLGQ